MAAFVKNAGLGLGIPYLHGGEQHEYVLDFLVRLAGPAERHVLLEIKGYDPPKDLKRAAAERWCAAVNLNAAHGLWSYAVATAPGQVRGILGGLVG